MATTTVLRLIRTAPAAGLSNTPCLLDDRRKQQDRERQEQYDVKPFSEIGDHHGVVISTTVCNGIMMVLSSLLHVTMHDQIR